MTNLDRLNHEWNHGRVVPVVGSGVSLSVQADGQSIFPSWGQLLNELADAVPDADDATVIRTHVKKRRWYKAAWSNR